MCFISLLDTIFGQISTRNKFTLSWIFFLRLEGFSIQFSYSERLQFHFVLKLLFFLRLWKNSFTLKFWVQQKSLSDLNLHRKFVMVSLLPEKLIQLKTRKVKLLKKFKEEFHLILLLGIFSVESWNATFVEELDPLLAH